MVSVAMVLKPEVRLLWLQIASTMDAIARHSLLTVAHSSLARSRQDSRGRARQRAQPIQIWSAVFVENRPADIG
ncbi:hypothetical protein [Haladaptatus litoreus]|uniref:hypothetical protein n=1 Tax=Haladaptatus litoreus TaxID=553468 RepID=UPI0011158CD5|nr:hypothetical protein [Haladaptatus litoreus]